MFIIYGRKQVRIKRYHDHGQSCKSCRAFDFDIKIFKEYFHIFFIPFFPVGIKSSSIRCNSCSEPIRIDSLQKQYEDQTRNPFYLFSGLILIGCLVVFMAFINQNTQNEKKKFVEYPKVGDVYGIRKDTNSSTEYYFLRVSKIVGGSIYVYHNNLVYGQYVYEFNNEDFFVKEEELIFSKAEVLTMLESGEINSVNRDYGSSEGFNRVE